MAKVYTYRNAREASRASTNYSNISLPIPAIYCALTSTPAELSAPTKVIVPAQTPTLA